MMVNVWFLFFAALPVILLLFLILGLRWSIAKAMLISLFLLLITVIFIWQMPFNWVLAASVKGLLIALEITLIIFGAILFLNILNKKGFGEKFKVFFRRVSQDRRVEIVVISFAFVALIEGSSGFGTPAMLAAPILIFLGFPVLAAIVLTLVGASMFSIFGALGLPITLGLRSVLENYHIGFIEISSLIAFLNVLIGFLILLIMIFSLIYLFGPKENKKLKYVLEMIPFLLFTSLVVTGPGLIITQLLGPELASLLGGLIGLVLLMIFIQKGWLIPKTKWDFKEEKQLQSNSAQKTLLNDPQDKLKSSEQRYIDSVELHSKNSFDKKEINFFQIAKILFPYFILVLILFFSRADFLPLEAWLQNTGEVSFQNLLGADVDYSFSLLYSIGTLFIVVSLVVGLIYQVKVLEIKDSFKNTFIKIRKPLLTLMVTLVFVKIFVYSGYGEIESMIIVLGQGLFQVVGGFWPIFSPMIGSAGAFITGSVTVSNLLLGGIQAEIAAGLGLSVIAILAGQGIGAALGNMIALHNIIAVCSVAEFKGKESQVILYNLPVVIVLTFILGFIIFLFF